MTEYTHSPGYMEGPRILVIQTGKMREKYIPKGVDSLANASKTDGEKYIDPDFVHHRFLPQELEAKYEAIDFVEKFRLNFQSYFKIYDDEDSNVKILSGNSTGFLNWGAPDGDLLLDKVNVVVAVGSTSIQAFKLTRNGVISILPMSDETRSNPAVYGNKDDPNLTEAHLARLSTSKDIDVAHSVLSFIRENTSFGNSSGEYGNAVFVNQIGYSVLGFNPRGRDAVPHVPTTEQKVVSMRDYKSFTDNNGKTALINVFQNILKSEVQTSATNPNNVFVVARQCKAIVGCEEHDISGQWANQAIHIIKEPSLLLPEEEFYDTIVDLGGCSGTSYSLTEPILCGWLPFVGKAKYTRDKYFMNTPSMLDFMKEKGNQPNDFVDCVDAFACQFNRELMEVYDDLSQGSDHE